MPYFKKFDLAFVHIPRTGGSSLELSLGLPSSVYKKNELNLKYIFGNEFQHLTFIELDYLISLFDIKPKKYFSIFRNPYEKLLSEINFLQVNYNLNDFFNYYFLKSFNNYFLLKNRHFMPQNLYLKKNKFNQNKIIDVYLTEELHTLFKDLNLKKIKKNKAISIKQDNLLIKKYAFKYYEKDFELYNLLKDKPINQRNSILMNFKFDDNLNFRNDLNNWRYLEFEFIYNFSSELEKRFINFYHLQNNSSQFSFDEIMKELLFIKSDFRHKILHMMLFKKSFVLFIKNINQNPLKYSLLNEKKFYYLIKLINLLFKIFPKD